MVEKLSLPAQAMRGGIIRVIAPVVVITQIVSTLAVAIALKRDQAPNASSIVSIVTGFVIVLGIFNLALFRFFAKPAEITINRTSIDVKPIAICGFGGGVAINHSVTEFDCVELATLQGKGGPIYKVALRNKNGKEGDLLFDPPAKMDLHEYVARLGATLNLKVNGNAAN